MAYSASAYLVFKKDGGHVSNLLYSTAKILGLRRFTVPRTELLSAELLVKITKIITILFTKTNFYVLCTVMYCSTNADDFVGNDWDEFTATATTSDITPFF